MTDLKCTECGHEAAWHGNSGCFDTIRNQIGGHSCDCPETPIAIYRAEIERLTAENESLAEAMGRINRKLTAMEEARTEMYAERDTLAARVKELTAEVADLQARIDHGFTTAHHTTTNAHSCCVHDPNVSCCDNHREDWMLNEVQHWRARVKELEGERAALTEAFPCLSSEVWDYSESDNLYPHQQPFTQRCCALWPHPLTHGCAITPESNNPFSPQTRMCRTCGLPENHGSETPHPRHAPHPYCDEEHCVFIPADTNITQTKGCSIEGCPNLADEVYVEGGYCVKHDRNCRCSCHDTGHEADCHCCCTCVGRLDFPYPPDADTPEEAGP